MSDGTWLFEQSSFELSVESGTFEVTVVGRPVAATSLTRNTVEVRLRLAPAQLTAGVVAWCGLVAVGAFQQFMEDLSLLATHGRERAALESVDGSSRLTLSWVLGRSYKLDLQADAGEAPGKLAITLWPWDVSRIYWAFEDLRHHFAFEPSTDFRVEASEAERRVLLAFKEELLRDDYRQDFARLLERGWRALVVPSYWLSGDVRRGEDLVRAIHELGHDDVLVHTFVEMPDLVPPFAKVPARVDSLFGFFAAYSNLYNALLTTHDRAFGILYTHDDYMIIAGPASFIRRACNGRVLSTRLDYRQSFTSYHVQPKDQHNAYLLREQEAALSFEQAVASLGGAVDEFDFGGD